MKTGSLLRYFLWIGLLLGACVRGDDYDIPPLSDKNPTSKTKANTTIQQLKASHTGQGRKKIEDDLIIEGTVTANDEQGNFFMELFLEDAGGGIRIKVAQKELSKIYPLGQKLQIHLKGLYLDKNFEEIQVGAPYTDKKSGKEKFGGINNPDKHLFKVDKDHSIEPVPLEIKTLDDTQLGHLVRIEGIQFRDKELAKTYADAQNKKSVSLELVDCQGKSLLLYTSGYARFAGEKIAQGKGSVSGILLKYKKDYQLVIRDLNDIQMENARCEATTSRR